MTHLSNILFLLVLLCITSSCNDKKNGREEYAIRINDYTISTEQIDRKLKFEAELESNFYISEDIRAEFVADLIQQQLFIQQAKLNKLDERERFRQTIQRYWESTLIRDLLEQKGKEIQKSILVTREEIEQYYNTNRDQLEKGTFEELEPELARILEEKKKSLKFEQWIQELKQKAQIEIKDPVLARKLGENKFQE